MIGTGKFDVCRQIEFIPVTQFSGLQQKAFTPLLTMTDGSTRFSYSPGGGDIKGATKPAGTEGAADQASGPVNAALIGAEETFTVIAGAAGAKTVSAQTDVARNLIAVVHNDSGGNLDLAADAGATVLAVVGTFRGAAQTENITLTVADAAKTMATAKFRYWAGVKPFDTITSITVTNPGAGGLKLSVAPGTALGLPVDPDANLEADILKVTVNAANQAVTGNYNTTNKTYNVGTIADGADVGIVYKIDYDGAAGTIAEIAVDTLLVSAGVGNPPLVEKGSLGLMALKMNNPGDDIRHMMRIPSHWDQNNPIRVYFVWSCESNDPDDTVDWKFLWRFLKAETTVIAAPVVALSTAIAQDVAKGTAGTLQRTAAGVLNAKTLKATAGYDYINFLCEMDAKAGGLAEDIHLYGVEFEFTPRWHNDQNRLPEAPAWRE